MPSHSGASATPNCVVIAPSVTKEIAQNCPVGGVAGEPVDPVRITHPASPKDCLSMLFVIEVVYRIKGWVSRAIGSVKR